MNVTIDQIRLFNRCPLLLKQVQLYQKQTGLSRTFYRELLGIFNSVFYQKMRGRSMDLGRVTKQWKNAAKKIQRSYPDAKREAFDFPAQCLSVFLDSYFKTNGEDIIGPAVPFETAISPHTIVADSYPLLSRAPFGTRITVFTMEPTQKHNLLLANDILYTIYSKAYRSEFGKQELAITIHNLGDDRKYDIVNSMETYQRHMTLLESLGELMYSKYTVPSSSACLRCPVKAPCNVRQHECR